MYVFALFFFSYSTHLSYLRLLSPVGSPDFGILEIKKNENQIIDK